MRTGGHVVVRRRLARVHFICDVHRAATGMRTSGTLTIVGGKWAYCRAPRILGHRWVPTGGVPITRILADRVG